MSDTHIEGLEEIAGYAQQLIDYAFSIRAPNPYTPNLVMLGQSIQYAIGKVEAHIPAVKALQEEVERLKPFADVGLEMVKITTTVRGEEEWGAIPELWKMCLDERDQLRATNAAQAEQLAKLEHILEPIQASVDRAEAMGRNVQEWIDYAKALEANSGVAAASEFQRLRDKITLLQSSTPAESQLAGGEAVIYRYKFRRNVSEAWSDWSYVENKPNAEPSDVFQVERGIFTAPAIKQQVASNEMLNAGYRVLAAQGQDVDEIELAPVFSAMIQATHPVSDDQQVAEDVADKSAAKHFNCDDSQLHVCHECDGYGVRP